LEETKPRKWRWGFKRWIVLVLVIIGIFAARAFPPITPHIQVAPENVSRNPLFSLPVIGDFYLTNTLIAMLIVDVIILALALGVRATLRKGTLLPGGITGLVEFLIEFIYNLTESTAGKYAKKIFPFFATIMILVLVSNLMELIPGVDSIGRFEEYSHGYAVAELIPNSVGYLFGPELDHGGEVIVPYVRVLSTDLNFTAALALISVFFTQVIGVQAKGFRYFSKFFNTTTFFKKPIFGAIDFAVGILELISEFSKILSFAFRLFGNIFAGAVLLFLVGSLIPVFAQSAILLFEFFIGLIQAFVFGMLTMVFMSQATQGHGGEEHH